jgi:hypothetical protein
LIIVNGNIMKKRTISIDEISYKKISNFCKENTLVMSAWVERILLQKIEEMESEYEKTRNGRER